MVSRFVVAIVGLACTVFLFFQTGATAQVRYTRGQNVAPIFEGWQRKSDGSFDFVFGYMNRNYGEELDIPVGPDNECSPAPVDCGQPTHFGIRRKQFVFRVNVPATWPKDKVVLWTLKSRGTVQSAKAWLTPRYEIDDGTIVENNTGGRPEPGNKPPTITKGSERLAVTLPNVTTVAVTATDDSLPKPKTGPAPAPAEPRKPSANPLLETQLADRRARRPDGVGVEWVHYRGPVGGKVKFDPATNPPIFGAPVTGTTKATFTLPGEYVLRAIVSDGQLFAVFDVPVMVSGAAGESR